jgi:xylose dehydrogenase (NAD/NADP)
VTVGWGFVGAGWIADRAMAPAVHAAPNATLAAVASRDIDRARRLGPRDVRGSYSDVLADTHVDVVYVCLANHLHREWVLQALAAGKHVVCEKPLGINAAQVEEMQSAARSAELLLVEAVWSRWHPRSRRMVELVRGGTLGDLEAIDSSFTFSGMIDGNYRADPAMGGGALLDVGGYQIHAWVAMTEPDAPVRVEAVEQEQGPTGVDLTTRASVVIDDRTRARLECSFALPEHQSLVVRGSAAEAAMGVGAAFTTWREASTLRVGGRVESFEPVDAYELMVQSVSAHVRGEDAFVVPVQDSVRVARIVDEISGS